MISGTTNDIFAKHYMKFAKDHIDNWKSTGFLDGLETQLERAKCAILLANQSAILNKFDEITQPLCLLLTRRIFNQYFKLETFWPIIYTENDSYLNLNLPVKNGNLLKCDNITRFYIDIGDELNTFNSSVHQIDDEKIFTDNVCKKFDDTMKFDSYLIDNYFAVFYGVSTSLNENNQLVVTGQIVV